MTEDMKRCIQCSNTYPSDMFHVRVRICDTCREQNKIQRDETKKQWKLNNPEKVKAYRQKTQDKYADEIKERKKKYKQSQAGRAKTQEYQKIIYHCDICGYDIKKYKKSRHEKSKKHLERLQRNMTNENLAEPKGMAKLYAIMNG